MTTFAFKAKYGGNFAQAVKKATMTQLRATQLASMEKTDDK